MLPRIEFNENTTPTLHFLFVDDFDNPVPGSYLETLLLTLYSVHTGDIINNRDHQNVRNQNGVTVDEQANGVWQLVKEDMKILHNVLRLEHHKALFEWTWLNGTKSGNQEFDIYVRNLSQVTS